MGLRLGLRLGLGLATIFTLRMRLASEVRCISAGVKAGMTSSSAMNDEG